MVIDPIVSVNMITYNHEPYIARAIEGVINQITDFSFELVIGEDCSTDNTRCIVFDYMNKYPNIIRLITSDNNIGAAKNLQRTELASCGKYIAYCEGDDYWHDPNKLQIQVGFLESNPDYGMVHSNADQYRVEKDILEKSVVTFLPEHTDRNAYFDILTGNRDIFTVTVCVRKDLLFGVLQTCPECTDEKYLMWDDQRWLEISRLAKVKYFHDSLATYNLLPESASRGIDPNKAVRFQLSAKEIRYHYLSKYECPVEIARQTKYSRIVKLLNRAILANDVEIVKNEISELRALHFKPHWRYYMFYLGHKNRLYQYLYDFLRSIASLKNLFIRKI